MRRLGRITTWNDDRGYGFISPGGGEEQVFVHIKAFSNRHRRPIGNELVTYEAVLDEKRRMRAEHVEFIGDSSPVPVQRGTIALAIPVLFLMFLWAAVFWGQLPRVVLVLYLVTSVVSLFAYAHDKSAAKKEQWRTPENTLHLLSVIGGWPGAFVAQKWFRHKSRKESFQSVFWATVVLNLFGLAWVRSSSGAAVLGFLEQLARSRALE
ncbi:MAG TPA: cold shock and DUF1294 domain-containing protein [Terriglobia bacterium]|nr:cold shock and DUF1294 domain-containing protein [Terriglobia bacterium]